MSGLLSSRSPDLARLREEGYEIEVREGHLLVHEVPYVTTERTIARGTLAAPLKAAGDVAAPPDNHTVWFTGGRVCDQFGVEIAAITNPSAAKELFPGFAVQRMFSARPMDLPEAKYPDFYSKVTRYAAILGNPAAALDPTATARTFGLVATSPDESVFRYMDTASARAGISARSARLAVDRVAVVGVGGTGSYVLDFLAKTPVKAIHLFDGDALLNHNAFRAPGAATLDELRAQPNKATHFATVYDRMRRGIEVHAYPITAANVQALATMDFVFVCVDDAPAKRLVVDALLAANVPFINVGMGLYEGTTGLGGILTATMATPAVRHHLARRISFANVDEDDPYEQNIQIAELNALNAALAVIRWKKWCGFYADLGHEYHTAYTVETNSLVNDECVEGQAVPEGA